MTKLLDEALAAVRDLPAADQDEVARAILRWTGRDDDPALVLSPEERAVIASSKAAAARGDFASDEEVRLAWAKHGL